MSIKPPAKSAPVSAARRMTIARTRAHAKPSMVEIYVSGRHLINMDTLSLSDPLVVMYILSQTGTWLEVGRTEEIKDDLEPVFKATFAIPYVPDRPLRFLMYDVDKPTDDMTQQDFIGEMVCTLQDILSADRHQFTRDLVNPNALNSDRGALTVSARELHDTPDSNCTSGQLQAIVRALSSVPTVPRSEQITERPRNPGYSKESFSGRDAINFMAREVLRCKGKRDVAIEELQFCLDIRYLIMTAFDDWIEEDRFVDDPRVFYAVNNYVLNPNLANDVLKPVKNTNAIPSMPSMASSSVSPAGDDAHPTFVKDVDGRYFLPTTWQNAPDIRFGKTEGGATTPPVVAASVDRLVERMTYWEYPDMDLINAFLLTYQGFVLGETVLDRLRTRVLEPVVDDEDPALGVKHHQVVQVRVLNLIKHWVGKYPMDFKRTPLEAQLDALLTEIIGDDPNLPLSRLALSIKELIAHQGVRGSVATQVARKPSILPPGPLVPGKITLLQLDPREVARQLALIDQELLANIQPREFLGLKWSKGKKETEAPHILQMIASFNHISGTARDMIIKCTDLEERADYISRWLDVAQRSAELNNFNGVLAIMSALMSTAVNRLKKTWEVIKTRGRPHDVHRSLKALVETDQNSRTLRTMIKCCHPPGVPYLGLFLTDLTFLEEGNKNTTSDNLINFSKFSFTAERISQIEQFQLVRYADLEPVTEIQNFLRAGTELSEDAAYEQSLRIEPRNRPPPDLNVLAEENRHLKDEVTTLQEQLQRMEAKFSALEKLVNDLTAPEPDALDDAVDDSSLIQISSHFDQGSTSNTFVTPGTGTPSASPASTPAATTAGTTTSTATTTRTPPAVAPRPRTSSKVPKNENSSAAAPSDVPAGTAAAAPAEGNMRDRSQSVASEMNGEGADDDEEGNINPADQRAANSFAAPLKTGFLSKKSGRKIMGSWQRRFCVCDSGYLFYFKSNTEPKQQGAVVLAGSSILPANNMGKEHCFQIVVEKRTFFFVAENAKVMKEWMEILTTAASTGRK